MLSFVKLSFIFYNKKGDLGKILGQREKLLSVQGAGIRPGTILPEDMFIIFLNSLLDFCLFWF